MTSRTKILAVIGLAGAFAVSAITSSIAAPKYPQDSYEAWGVSKPEMPPVPGAARAGYKVGMCWKITNQNWQLGEYISCSECKKLNKSICPH